MSGAVIVFVDFDGTITDVDTFDLLVRSAAGDAAWEALDGALVAGRITLREALARQAALVRYTHDDARAVLAAGAHVDPAFAPFVATARAHGAEVVVVSSGIGSLIRAALRDAGLPADLAVHASDVDYAPGGWTMTFLDPSDNGHDKAARVRAAHGRTVYVGDGISDAEAALVAERRFAKRGRWLERYLLERAVPFTSFASFEEVTAALFGAAPASFASM